MSKFKVCHHCKRPSKCGHPYLTGERLCDKCFNDYKESLPKPRKITRSEQKEFAPNGKFYSDNPIVNHIGFQPIPFTERVKLLDDFLKSQS